MIFEALGKTKLEGEIWAKPRKRWFNYVPCLFANKKMVQLEVLAEEMEKLGNPVLDKDIRRGIKIADINYGRENC